MAGRQHILLLRPLGAHSSALTSHTLFGATCWALATLGRDVGALLATAARDGARFALSAPFPYVLNRDGAPILLLPRPSLHAPSASLARTGSQSGTAESTPFAWAESQSSPAETLKADADRAKRARKVGAISQGVAAHWRAGTWNAVDLRRLIAEEEVYIVRDVLFTRAEVCAVWGSKALPPGDGLDLPWHAAIVPHNSVDRVAGATVAGLLFQQEEMVYDAARGGLWCGVWTADDAMWQDVQAAFRYLGDTGLGGNRTIGKGHFTFDVAPWEATFPAVDAARFVTLGHYIPRETGEAEALAYTLDVIQQKIENRYPQAAQRVCIARVRAFAPGGLFAAQARRDVYGRLVPLDDVGDRTVYYSGATLPLWGKWE